VMIRIGRLIKNIKIIFVLRHVRKVAKNEKTVLHGLRAL
jgi:hypothetical protein